MIKNVNDSLYLAEKLAEILDDLNCHVNLIQLNPNAHYPEKPSSMDQINNFGNMLLNKHIPVSIRSSLGADILAGCGQLAGQISSNE